MRHGAAHRDRTSRSTVAVTFTANQATVACNQREVAADRNTSVHDLHTVARNLRTVTHDLRGVARNQAAVAYDQLKVAGNQRKAASKQCKVAGNQRRVASNRRKVGCGTWSDNGNGHGNGHGKRARYQRIVQMLTRRNDTASLPVTTPSYRVKHPWPFRGRYRGRGRWACPTVPRSFSRAWIGSLAVALVCVPRRPDPKAHKGSRRPDPRANISLPARSPRRNRGRTCTPHRSPPPS